MIIFVIGMGTNSSGTAIESVPGFESKALCETARQQLMAEGLGRRSFCVQTSEQTKGATVKPLK